MDIPTYVLIIEREAQSVGAPAFFNLNNKLISILSLGRKKFTSILFYAPKPKLFS
jgi:hypothetical protein